MKFIEPLSKIMTYLYLHDILRIVHHHYKNGRNIVVSCYYDLNRSPGVKYYYHIRYLNEIIPYKSLNSYLSLKYTL